MSNSVFTNLPSILKIGGAPTVKCRSEAWRLTINSSNSLSVTIFINPLIYLSTNNFRTEASQCRLGYHFFDGRDTEAQLFKAGMSEAQHTLLYGMSSDFRRRNALDNQLLDRGRYWHDLKTFGPSRIAGIIALVASLALVQLEALGLFGGELQWFYNLRRDRNFLLAEIAYLYVP